MVLIYLFDLDRKAYDHTETQIKRREPGIFDIMRKYNNMCSKLKQFIVDRVAPPGSTAPPKINYDKLFALDVDDEIWQDIGLDIEPGDSGAVLAWLCDEKVREGIRWLLEEDRCAEESVRLQRESVALRSWFLEEWQAVTQAQIDASGSSIFYLFTA
ncbi:MAG: hypothetical protein ACREHG_02725 [Candidatus Saccharimonadales bacterium]